MTDAPIRTGLDGFQTVKCPEAMFFLGSVTKKCAKRFVIGDIG